MPWPTQSRLPAAVPDNPLIRPILPLLYVAWADGELTREEIRQIRTKLAQQFMAVPEAEAFLQAWLVPESPPTAVQMQSLLLAIRKGAPVPDIGRSKPGAAPGDRGPASAASGAEREAPPGDAIADVERIVGIDRGEALGLVVGPDGRTETPDPEHPFDIRPLRDMLDGAHGALRDRLRALLGRPEFALRFGLSDAAYREQVYRWCKRLARERLGGFAFPPECGGDGDHRKSFVTFEMLAFHDASLLIKYGVQFGLFGGAINMLGTQRHRDAYLRKIASLELPGCFAMTELGHGSNVAALQTTATFDPDTDRFIVNTPGEAARKEYIGNAACHARVAVVFAQLVLDGESHGVHAFVVPIRGAAGKPLPGVRIGDSGAKMGLNGVDNGRLWFDRVAVPRENLLNRYADVGADGTYTSPIASPSKRFFSMLGALVAGRLSVGLAALSCAKTGLAIAVRYGESRRQFGRPGQPETRILDYLTHQRRLLPPLATAFALDCALKSATRDYAAESARPSRALEGLIAGLKAYGTRYALDTLGTCRECCGGQGYLAANRLGSLLADAEIFVTFEGDNTVLLQLVAKGLLTDYRRQFEDLRAFTVVKHLAAKAETAMTQLNPVITRQTGRAHLRDPKFQRDALLYREGRLLATAARRLRHRISNGSPPEAAFGECQDHLVTLARAHVERVVHDRMSETAQAAEAGIRPVLASLRDMFALSRLEADRAWFLESGYFAPAKSKAVRRQVNALCRELRPGARALVDAFGIPEALLPAMPTGH